MYFSLQFTLSKVEVNSYQHKYKHFCPHRIYGMHVQFIGVKGTPE